MHFDNSVKFYAKTCVESIIRIYRHTASRQFVRWCGQWLEKDARRVIPSCAVVKIRETVPSTNTKASPKDINIE